MGIKTYGGFLMSQIRHLSGRVWEKLLKESGIDAFNGPQGRILYVLWENGTLTISQIGKLTSLANTTLTSMLDRMEEAELISRIPNSANRRQTLVSVTEKALEYREMYERISDRMGDAYYDGFTEEEVTNFEGNLRKIISNLEKAEV